MQLHPVALSFVQRNQQGCKVGFTGPWADLVLENLLPVHQTWWLALLRRVAGSGKRPLVLTEIDKLR